MAKIGLAKVGLAKVGPAKISTGVMVVLFWTGLASGPAGAANGRNLSPAPVVSSSALRAEVEATDRWLAEMAAHDISTRPGIALH